MAGPIVGYGLQDAAGASGVPFKVLGRQILTDPRETLGLSDDLAYAVGVIRLPRELWADGTVEIVAAGSQAEGKAVPIGTIKLTDLPYARAMTFTGKVPARDLAPDYYELRVTLKNGRGEAVDDAKASFIVSPATAVPHPVTIVKPLPAANNHLYYYGLAIQYDKTGDKARAEALLEKAHAMRPDYLEGVVQFADFLVRAGKPDRALELAEELAGAERFRFDHFLIKGQALRDKGDYAAGHPGPPRGQQDLRQRHPAPQRPGILLLQDRPEETGPRRPQRLPPPQSGAEGHRGAPRPGRKRAEVNAGGLPDGYRAEARRCAPTGQRRPS